MAERVLRALATGAGAPVLQPDAGIPLPVQVDRAEGAQRRAPRFVLTIEAPCADRVEAWLDGRAAAASDGPGPRFVLEPRSTPAGDHLLIVVASRDGERIAYRSLRVRFGR